MLALATAIEVGDAPTIERRFAVEGFGPPQISWNPSPDQVEIKELGFLLNYWRGLSGDDPIPHFNQVDALDLGPCLGYLMVLDIGEAEFTYRVYGTKIARASGFDLTGKTVSSITSHALIPTFFNACYRAMLNQRLPLMTQHQAPPEISVYHWNRLILPLADDAGRIVRILAGNVPGPFRIHRTEIGAQL